MRVARGRCGRRLGDTGVGRRLCANPRLVGAASGRGAPRFDWRCSPAGTSPSAATAPTRSVDCKQQLPHRATCQSSLPPRRDRSQALALPDSAARHRDRSNRATCRTILRMRARVAHGIRKLFRAIATEQVDGFRQIGRAHPGSLRVTQWSSSVQLRDDSLHVELCNFALELLEHRRELLVRSNRASGRG